MNRQQLISEIHRKKSFLCIGLDTDLKKIPSHLLDQEDPVFEFNRQIVEATHDLCIAFKPNMAFYEINGSTGWMSLEKTLKIIPENIFKIADAKRGDIGNTSTMYAEAFFKTLNFDAITVAPYMGEDSVKPFLQFENKWVILLALTSNSGSKDFQMLMSDQEEYFFSHVLETASSWSDNQKMMFVVGATHPRMMERVRAIVPDHFFLVPGIGAQGGSLEEVCKYGLNRECGLIVNSSRDIIYAGNGKDFAEKARDKALAIQRQMSSLLEQNGF